jgi:hypothetical protein
LQAATAGMGFYEDMVDKKGDLQLLEITGQLPRRKNLQSILFSVIIFRRIRAWLGSLRKFLT